MTNREWNSGELLELCGILSSIILWTAPSPGSFFPQYAAGNRFRTGVFRTAAHGYVDDAGLKDIQRLPIQTPNDTGLITDIV
jgi:hypothetical protein